MEHSLIQRTLLVIGKTNMITSDVLPEEQNDVTYVENKKTLIYKIKKLNPHSLVKNQNLINQYLLEIA
jgi:hypothetical protein